jgi:hypothetical protein
VILLDSDEEGSSTPAFVDRPEFEEEEEEFDASRPYPGILQDLDLYFGTDVIHLALLPTSLLTVDGASWRGLEGLKQKIVFTAACADNVVRFVTLPLTPLSPASKSRPEFQSNFTIANAGNGKWGETVVTLSGHQRPSDGVAMTGVAHSNPKSDQTKSQLGAHIIIASHSREVTGLLLLYKVPVSSPMPAVEPFQTVNLTYPARSISFNPSLSPQRSNHLLVADTTGVCRIYDYSLLVKSAVAEDPSNIVVVPEHGTWLLSLYPGFQKNKTETPTSHLGAHAGFGRRTIVDAKWVAGGKAILVLLSDGEWAIWDIEGVGPGASQGLLGRQGIRGGSRSEFSLSGIIKESKSRASGPPQITGSKFAPMTPGTRKSTNLFGTKTPSGPIRGQISVIDVPSTSPSSPSEESIVFWLGDSFTIIPNLSKYWAANARKSSNGSNLFNGAVAGRMIKLEGIDLQGERCSGIDQLIKAHPSTGLLPSDIVILGEHRFTILSAGKPQSQFQPSTRLALVEKSTNSGELDVVGIDQALARMEYSNGFGSKSRNFH